MREGKFMGPRRVLSPEQEKTIAERYLAGETADAIAKDFKVHGQTIHNTLKRLGIEKPKARAKRHVPQNEREAIVAMCQNGATSIEAARAFNTSQETVLRILKARDVRLSQGRPRECDVDDNAFDAITPESAYWMGFLFADGCIHQDAYGSPALICGLAEKDRGHLEKLRAFLKSTHAITRSEPTATSYGGPCVYFRVRSTRLCAALSLRGIVKKRWRTPIPEIASSPDFWRGAVDGDGWIGTSVQEYNTYSFLGLSGQMPLLETFKYFLNTHKLADPKITPTESGVWRVQTMGSSSDEIIEILYKDATIALDRKNARAQTIISGEYPRFPPYTEEPSKRFIPSNILNKLLASD